MSRTMKTAKLTFMALMAAVLCVLAPISLSVGAVPVSVATFVIYVMVYIIGYKYAVASVGLYILIGLTGLPVFSGYIGGLSRLAGPTGGYIIGYIFMAFVGGCLLEKIGRKYLQAIISYVAATVVLYVFGTIWYVVISGSDMWGALVVCVFPFLIFDFVKIIAGVLVGSKMRNILLKSGIEI